MSLHEDAAERAVLGSLLTGAPIADDLADVLTGRDFYQPRHETVYDACQAVHRDGHRIDPPLVARKLGPDLPRVGGPLFLSDLTSIEAAPHPAQARQYAAVVRDAALTRRLSEAARSVIERAESSTDAAAFAEEARRMVDEAASHAMTADAGERVGPLLARTLDTINGDREPGIPTPWPDLDDTITGLMPGQLVVVGARPSMGKSVLGMNLAASVAASGRGVYVASLEMTRHELMCRMLSASAGVDLARVLHHRCTEDDWSKISLRASAMSDWPLTVDDTTPTSLLQLRSRLRTATRTMPDGLSLVVVDYLQLMEPRDRRVPREQQVGELSEGLKVLAKELGVPIVALAQLNRAGAQRANHRPVLSDLRESGRIEADADQVWLLHRQDMVDPESATGELEVNVAKNRNGPLRTIPLAFQGHYSRATSLAM